MSKFRDKALHARAVAAAKRKFKVWPSAYASGYVVQYKRLYKKHGSLSGVSGDDLGKWFGEKWVRILPLPDRRTLWRAQQQRGQAQVSSKSKGSGIVHSRAQKTCGQEASQGPESE